jgi:hypothetical protein
VLLICVAALTCVVMFFSGIEIGYRRGRDLANHMQSHCLAQHCIAVLNKADSPLEAKDALNRFIAGAMREIDAETDLGIMNSAALSISEIEDVWVYKELINSGVPILDKIRKDMVTMDASGSELVSGNNITYTASNQFTSETIGGVFLTDPVGRQAVLAAIRGIGEDVRALTVDGVIEEIGDELTESE